MEKNENPLTPLIQHGIRVVWIVELSLFIMFALYYNLEHETGRPTVSLGNFFFIMLGHTFTMLIAIYVIYVPTAAMVLLQLLILVASCNLAGDIYQSVVVWDEPHTWSTIFMIFFFLSVDVLYVFLSVFARVLVDDATWDDYVADLDENGQLWIRKTWFVDAMEHLLPVEFVLWIVYIVTLLSLLPSQYNFTGWVFSMHLFNIIASMAWLLEDDPEEKKQAKDQMAMVFFAVLVFDVSQLSFVQELDQPILIAMRCFLTVICGLELGMALYDGLDVRFPKKPVLIYYAVQFVLSAAAMVEFFMLIGYFCYAFSVPVYSVMYWNMLHWITTLLALATVMSGAGMLDVIRVLGIASVALSAYEGLVFSIMTTQARLSTEYAVQVVLFLVVLTYMVVFLVVWIGATDDDERQYLAIKVKERHSLVDLTRAVKPKWDKSEWKDNALRIHYIITGCIKTVAVIESVLLFYYMLVLTSGTNIHWEQWFYTVHFVSIFAAFLCVSLEVDAPTSVQFVIIAAIISLLIDVIMMGVLEGDRSLRVPDGTVALQSFFLICDLLYIVFTCIISYNADARAWTELGNIESLSDFILKKS